MSKDKTKIFIIELFLTIVLAICTLFRLTSNKFFTAGLLTISAISISLLLKRERQLKVNKRKILIIMIVFGILYVSLFYTMGIYTGFYRQNVRFGLKSIVQVIFPITTIIITTELIRNKLLLNDDKKSKVLVTIIGTIIDISLYRGIYGFSNLESFLALLGFVTFAAIANNLLYTYVNLKYGKEPVIIYKLITIVYLFIIPVTPNVYIYFRTFVRMIYPLLIYSYLEKYYNLDKYRDRPKELRNQVISLSTGTILIVLIIALVSCKFLYGVLVIGSESMTGSIEKGDLILFKSKKENIEVGDVIVYKKDDLKIVHRVVAVKNINNEFRYYTKGDANPLPDDNYVTKQTLVGKVLFKIKYIGKPTLWLRNMFK